MPKEASTYAWEAGPSPDDARAAGLEGPRAAAASPQHEVLRNLSPEGAAPRSYFPEDRPASRQLQRELAARAEREGWPEASALPAANGRGALPRAPVSPEREELLPDARGPGEEPPGEVRRPSFAGQGFFAGFEELRAHGARDEPPSQTPHFAAFAGFGGAPAPAPRLAAFAGAEGEGGARPRRGPAQPGGGPRPEARSVTPQRRASSRRRSNFNFGAGQAQAGGSSPSRPPVRSSFLGTAPAAGARPGARRRSVRSSTDDSAGGGGLDPLDEAPGFFGSLFAAPVASVNKATRLLTRRPPDPGERYVDGACLDLAPALCPPDLAAIKEAGPAAVEEAYEQALAAQRDGLLGERDGAQVVLDYVAAVAGSGESLAKGGEVSAHVRLVSDMLAFYPKVVQIHLWGLEALMALFRHEGWDRAESLARPILDAVTDLMDTHERSPSLHEAVPDLPKRMLAAMALVLTPSTSGRLHRGHVDFALRVVQELEAGPIVTEHGLHVLLDARSPHRLREQAEAARSALRGFQSEPRLAPRALLALREAYLVAAESASTGVAGGELDLTERAAASGKAPKGARVPLGLREITTAMDLYAQDRKIQGAGAMALAAAVSVPGISLAAASQEGAIRAVTLAQQRFSSSRSVALQFCRVMGILAQREPELLSAEAALDVTQAGLTFQRDNDIAVAALEALHSLAPRLRELATGPSERLELFARDLVQLGEGRHTDPYALALIVVVLAVAASDGLGTDPGGTAGEKWRAAFGRAAVVVLPMRALYEHPADTELVCASAVALRCLTYGCAASCAHAGRVKAASVLLGTLARHVAHPDTSRELLSALGNCASDRAVFQEFQGTSERVQDVIYEAMESCARHEPDVLMQGCRALVALGALPDMGRVNAAMLSAGVGACERNGEEVQTVSLFGKVEISAAVTRRRERLAELCGGLLHPERALRLAAGPHFGRLVDVQGEPTPECLAHRRGSAAADGPARRPRSARRAGPDA
ncbi:unnamed protein product [Prorocentrum cordatum]|uniref:Uncharacterized protein n=1 Tax=Prorocentrum cordatum TaxID=2364126 RepID=A0ABN9STK7_9DINO|nr:unnamed protein product [Polarella glacialis]